MYVNIEIRSILIAAISLTWRIPESVAYQLPEYRDQLETWVGPVAVWQIW